MAVSPHNIFEISHLFNVSRSKKNEWGEKEEQSNEERTAFQASTFIFENPILLAMALLSIKLKETDVFVIARNITM